jgi:hypothetical protein
MQPQFAPALSRVQFLLTRASRDLKTSIHFALIGGLGVAAWGIVRATEDIDYLADSEPSPEILIFVINSKVYSRGSTAASNGVSATMTIPYRFC